MSWLSKAVKSAKKVVTNPLEALENATESTLEAVTLGAVDFEEGYKIQGMSDALAPEVEVSTEAADIRADLLRQGWEDYVQRFQPVAEDLMALSTWNSPGVATEEVATAKDRAGKAYGMSAEADQAVRQRYGVSLSADQQAAEDRRNALGMAAAVADAANARRGELFDRNLAIATGVGQSVSGAA